MPQVTQQLKECCAARRRLLLLRHICPSLVTTATAASTAAAAAGPSIRLWQCAQHPNDTRALIQCGCPTSRADLSCAKGPTQRHRQERCHHAALIPGCVVQQAATANVTACTQQQHTRWREPGVRHRLCAMCPVQQSKALRALLTAQLRHINAQLPGCGTPGTAQCAPEQHGCQWLWRRASRHHSAQLGPLEPQQAAAQVVPHALHITQLCRKNRGRRVV